MKKRIFKIKIFIVIIAAGWLSLSCIGMRDSWAKEGRFATIHKIEGTVEIRRHDGVWEPAEEGMLLYEKDEIRTDHSSYAELLLDEHGRTGRLQIKEDSRMRLNTLEEDIKTGDQKTLLDVAIGQVMVRVEKLKGDSKFEVNTPTSTVGVRGTAFEVVVKEEEGTPGKEGDQGNKGEQGKK